jgi:hypothetical protein
VMYSIRGEYRCLDYRPCGFGDFHSRHTWTDYDIAREFMCEGYPYFMQRGISLKMKKNLSWDSLDLLTPELPIPGDVMKCLEELGIQVQRTTWDEAWALCPKHEGEYGDWKKASNWSVLLEDKVDYDSGRSYPCRYSLVVLVMWF